MYAIVEIAGQQFKVVKDQKVFVHRLQTEEGKQVAFNNVLLLGDGDKVTIGAPAIGGAQVGAKVLKHLKGDKVIVFKKKRRKGYRVKNGHRQSLTEILIENIVVSGAKKATKAESEGAKPASAKAMADKPKAKVDAKPVAKPASAKATADKPKAKVEAKKVAPKAKVDAKPVAKPASAKATAGKKEEAKQDLSKMTVAQLKEMAKAKGITGISSMKKADLIVALS